MSTFQWPVGGSGGGVSIYPDFGSFPASATDGTLAVAADTHVLYIFNGDTTTWNVLSTAGSDLTSINSDTTSAQTLATGTAGTDFAIVDNGTGTHTFNLPVASATNTGKLSSSDWSTFNGKQPAGSYITALSGDVTASGPGSASATVAFVGGSSASSVNAATLLANAATDANTVSTIVKRDADGNFDISSIDFKNDLGADPTHLEGKQFYDPVEHTMAYYNDETDVKMNIRGDGPRVVNETGVDILDGRFVKIGQGGISQRPTITLANAAASQSEAQVEGVYAVATHTINGSGNKFGYVATEGATVNNVNTVALAAAVSQTWTEGQTLYAHPSFPGLYTNVRPSEPDHSILAATLIEHHASTGKLFVIGRHQNAVNKQDKFNGLEDGSKFTLTYNAETRVATLIAATGAAAWVNGVRYPLSGSYALTAHAGTTGKYYVYVDNTGTPVISNTAWDLFDSAPCFQIYYKHNATPANAKAIIFEERHPAQTGMSDATHHYLHEVLGTQFHNGGVISGYTLDTAGATALSYAISGAELDDEDLHLNTAAVPDGGPYMHMWVDGAGGTSWDWSETSTTGILDDGTNIVYNDIAAGTLVGVSTANRWINYWPIALQFYATVAGAVQTAKSPGYAIIVGQALYTSLANAQAATPANLSYISNVTVEGVVFARMTYARRTASPSNAEVDVDPVYFRGNVLNTVTGGFVPTDHQSLSNRTSADSHPATAITNVPAGNIAATTVQAAIDELDSEKIDKSLVDAKGDLITATADNTPARLPVGSYGQALVADSGTATGLKWATISGGINYVTNADAEGNATTGWATYADANQELPENGTGSAHDADLVTSASTPLRGAYSFIYSKLTGDQRGKGFSYDFTIDSTDKAKVLRAEFDYSINNTSGNAYETGDLTVWIYDVTNAVLIQPAPYKIEALGAGTTGKFFGEFQTSSNSTSYRLIVHTATTDTGVWELKFDNVKVGPGAKVFGAPVTDEESAKTEVVLKYGTTTATNITSYTTKVSRIGDKALLNSRIVFNGAANASGQILITLPNGWVADTTKMPASNPVIGWAKYYNGTTAKQFSGMIRLTGSTQLEILEVSDVGTTAAFWTGSTTSSSNTPAETAIASNDYMDIVLMKPLPILGWSSSLQLSDSADTRVVSFFGSNGSTQALTADVTNIAVTASKDSHGAWNGTQYIAPSAGDYFITINTADSAGGTVSFTAWKAGVSNVRLLATSTTTRSAGGNLVVGVNAGEALSVRCGSSITLAAGTTISIFKVQGPSQIAASEKIAIGAYRITSGQSITSGSDTEVVFNASRFDTHGAYSTSTGRFTAPVSGLYRVSYNLLATMGATAASAVSAKVYINGTGTAYIKAEPDSLANSKSYPLVGTGIIQLTAGQYISVFVLPTAQNITVAHSGATNDTSYFFVEKI